jgi:hypothetical protein
VTSPSGDRIVTTGTRGTADYRVSVDSSGSQPIIGLASRPGPGQPWSTSSASGPASGANALGTLVVTTVGDSYLVGGFVSKDTVRVEQRGRPGSGPVRLTIYPVADAPWNVAAGLVPEHTPRSTVTAYDASGAVTGRWTQPR